MQARWVSPPLIAVLLAACGATGARPAATEPGIIPWIATPAGPAPTPTPAPIPTPLAMRFCQVRDLGVRIGRTGAAAGTEYTDLVFTNSSASACQLQGRPALTFRDSSGAPAASVQPLEPSIPPNPVALPPGIAAGLEPAEAVPGQAVVMMGVPSVLCLRRPITTIQVDLPDGAGRLTQPWANGPGGYTGQDCYNGPIWVSAFASAVPATPAPEPPRDFSVDLILPASARVGGTLDYRVKLTNVSGRTIRFGTCPGYTESLKAGAIHPRYVLNCASIGDWAPARSLTFAMSLSLAGVDPQVLNGQPSIQDSVGWNLDLPYQALSGGIIQLTAP